jgi:hypothetical protein
MHTGSTSATSSGCVGTDSRSGATSSRMRGTVEKGANLRGSRRGGGDAGGKGEGGERAVAGGGCEEDVGVRVVAVVEEDGAEEGAAGEVAPPQDFPPVRRLVPVARVHRREVRCSRSRRHGPPPHRGSCCFGVRLAMESEREYSSERDDGRPR